MKKIIRQLCAALAAVGAVSAAPAQPNIVFILADDLGWSDTTLHGTTELYQTPNIAKLAERGMVFTHAYSASPLCSPTRASILSGQSPARTGVTAPNCHLPKATTKASRKDSAPPNMKLLGVESATRFDTAHFTLTEALKQQGYATGHFGKWHLGPPPYSPFEQGFDVDIPHTAAPGPPGGFIAPWAYQNDFKERTPGEHIEDRMADEAVAWMEKHKDQPFFLNYWQFSVHAPFDAKKELIEKYRKLVNPSAAQRCAVYAAMVESMDDAVGTLMAALERLGIAERTIIVFFSDNGGNMYNVVEGAPPTSNSPLRGGKATPWEGGVRVPCVIAWPGLTKAGSRNETPIQSEDFYPTFAELLGLKVPQEQIFDGKNIAPALRGGTLPARPLFRYFPHSPAKVPDKTPPTATVTLGDWKLMRFFHDGENGAHVHQLYNLREDIGETKNLAESEPARVAELSALIDGFLKDTGALVPLPNPAYSANASAGEVAPVGEWQPRGATEKQADGEWQVTPTGADPFLGLGAGGLDGPATLRLRLFSPKAGNGRLAWAASPKAFSPATPHIVYSLPAGEWSEIELGIPQAGKLGVIRLHLPAIKEAIRVDWIDLKAANGSKRWDF